MHKAIDINNLLLCAIFSALGIVVPILFHILGLGSTFLPMFFPLAIGAFFLSIGNAAILGIITPLVSALLTGMPPFHPPIAFIMTAELFVLCFCISVLCHKTKFPVIVIVAIAFIAERLVQILLHYVIMPYFGISAEAFSIYSIIKVVPGIILLLVVTPITVPAARKVLSKYALHLFEHSHEDEDEANA